MQPKPEWHKLVEENTGLCWEMVNRHCWNHSEHDKEDAVSECVLVLIRAAQLYNSRYQTTEGKPVKFSTYACTAIKRRIYQMYAATQFACRGGGKIETHNADYAEEQTHPQCTDANTIRVMEAKEQCDKLLSNPQLRPADKEVLRKVYFDGMRMKEVAKQKKVTGERIKQRVNRAIDEMRRESGVLA